MELGWRVKRFGLASFRVGELCMKCVCLDYGGFVLHKRWVGCVKSVWRTWCSDFNTSLMVRLFGSVQLDWEGRLDS